MLQMTDCQLANQRVLLREDLNVPIGQGRITNAERLKAALPTIRAALSGQARLLLLSHLGRPRPGEFDPSLSLAPVAAWLEAELGQRVPLRPWTDAAWRATPPPPGGIVLFENVRFLAGEREDDPALAERLASLCDLFVMDAFATAHRAEASTHGVILKAPKACAGPLLIQEVEALTRALSAPEHPLVAVVGGAKVSTKIELLNALLTRVDGLILGGGILNTLLLAQGFPVGQSLCEPDALDTARSFLAAAQASRVEIPVPVDLVVGHLPIATSEADVRTLDKVAADEMILDIGPATAARYESLLRGAKTILWNGPLGVFECDQFAQGTRRVAEAIVQSGAFTVVGGGDSLAALDKFQLADRVSYRSTAGGAFLEFAEGRVLPALEALAERARSN
jgi:phosphoglycerate kinase